MASVTAGSMVVMGVDPSARARVHRKYMSWKSRVSSHSANLSHTSASSSTLTALVSQVKSGSRWAATRWVLMLVTLDGESSVVAAAR